MEQSTLNKWDSYIQPPTDDAIQAQVLAVEDTSAEDYTVTTSAPVSTSSIIKLAMAGGFSVLVLLVMIGIFYFMSANSTPSQQAKQQQRPPKDRMDADKDAMLNRARRQQTFSDRHDRIQSIEDQNKPKPTTPKSPRGQTVPAKPPPTVQTPKVIYRNVAQPTYRPRPTPRPPSSPQRTFQVQRPAAVVANQPESEIDDPNYGFFTAPPAASSQTSTQNPTRPIQLTKSKQLQAKEPQPQQKKMVDIYKQPVQVASNSPKIPTPQPLEMQANLSGSLVNPYLKDTIASASQGVIPVDTVIDAEVKTRVSWIPENPGLAMGKEVRMLLNQDVSDTSGVVVARKGDVVVGKVTQANEQGMISVSVSQIGSKAIQAGAIEVHQDGGPTMLAQLERKGGRDNKILKTIVGMGADGVQTLTRSLNQPTSQTSFTNGNQTFLSSGNNRSNPAAAFVEGASSRVGEMIRNSDTGPTQSAIGVFRFKGDVQLYVVKEVNL